MAGTIQFYANGDVRGIASLRKRARGKLVLLGFDIDQVAGVFTSVEKALQALAKEPEMPARNWWLAFRKVNTFDKGCIFDRILLRTKSGGPASAAP